MSRVGHSFDRGADVEDHFTGIFVDCHKARVRGVPAGVEVHVVTEQRDTVRTLSATLHLGVVLPNQFCLLLSDVELPELLVLVAYVHKAVLYERREILVSFVWTSWVAQ